jgi:hypothetical protein
MRKLLNPSRLLAVVTLGFLPLTPLKAVIFYSTGDNTFNTTAPGGALAGSGWQYQGTFGNFLGTPIASQYFITAGHIGGTIGQTFVIDGNVYTTIDFFDDPNSDLRIWKINGTFAPEYIAPLYTGPTPTGEDLVVFGRGTERGAEVNNSDLQGWEWGAHTHVQRWGTNTVEGSFDGGAGVGQLLYATFDADAGSTEAMLSVGDSGGAVFIYDEGTWKLAGINYAVTGPYSLTDTGSGAFNAALFDENGFYVQVSGVWAPASGPGAFFSTSISANLAFINAVIPEPGTVSLGLFGALLLLRAARRGRKAGR